MHIEQLTALWSLLDRFKNTERNVFSVWTQRKENDSEHSFELAMICRYLATQYNKEGGNIQVEKVIIYALVHDLVEAYAGDTDTYSCSSEDYLTKHTKEMDALQKIKEETAFFPQLAERIESYESQQDEESQFVKSIDKSSYPLLQIRDEYRSRKYIWHQLSLQKVDEEKQKKLSHQYGKKLWNDLVTYFTWTLWRDKTKRFGDFL
jgi:putative hydrolases of HD superfamily